MHSQANLRVEVARYTLRAGCPPCETLLKLFSYHGAVRWVTELEGALPAGVVVSEDSLRHFGPVVAGGRVYVVSGKGNISAFNADTGEKLESVSVGAPSSTAPQVAAGKMFVLGSNGTLTVFE